MSESKNELVEEDFAAQREYRLARILQTQEELRKAEEISEAKLKRAQERFQQAKDRFEKCIWAVTFKWDK